MKDLKVFIDVKDTIKSIEYIEKIICLSKEARIAIIFFHLDLCFCDELKSFCKNLSELQRKNLRKDTCICIYHMTCRSKQLGYGVRKRLENLASHIYVLDVPGQEKKLTKLREWFEKRQIHFMVSLEEKNINDMFSRYQALAKFQLPLLADMVPEEKKMQSLFDEWSVDTNGVDISCFSDLISSGLLGYTQYDCVHKSCLGNTLAVSAEGVVSFCHKRKEATKLIHMSQVNAFMDFFEHEVFRGVIEKNIWKRRQCEGRCESFLHCMGGCPLTEDENSCFELSYQEMRNAVEKEMKAWIYTKDYVKINPAIRKIFLYTAASGKLKK